MKTREDKEGKEILETKKKRKRKIKEKDKKIKKINKNESIIIIKSIVLAYPSGDTLPKSHSDCQFIHFNILYLLLLRM